MPRTKRVTTEFQDDEDIRPGVREIVLAEDGIDASKMDVWEFQGILTAKQLWHKYISYLYELKPGRREGYLDKYQAEITREQIAEQWGGGEYLLYINRAMDDGSKPNVYKIPFTIVGAPKNRAGTAAAAPGNDPAAVTTLGKLAEAGSTLNQDTANLYLEAARERDRLAGLLAKGEGGPGTAAQLDLFDKMLATVEKMRGGANGNGESAILTMLFQMIMKQQEQTSAMILKMIETGGSSKKDSMSEVLLTRLLEREAPDPAATMQRYFELFSSFRGGAGSISRGTKTDWADVGMGLVEKIPEIANAIASVASMARTMPPPGNRPPSTVQPPASLPAAPVNNPASTGSPVQTTGNDGKPAASTDTATPPPAITPEIANYTIIQACKRVIVQGFQNGDPGAETALVCDRMHQPFAEHLRDLLLQAPNDPAVLATLQNDAILKELFLDPTKFPAVLKFAQEFVEYFEDDGAGQGSGAPAGAAA